MATRTATLEYLTTTQNRIRVYRLRQKELILPYPARCRVLL